jgi:PAS domain S-box-containing protein
VNGSIQNIDQRKRPQLLALRTLKEKNEILESIGDGFFAVDKKWKVRFWNSKAEAELGIKKEDMLERDLWSVFPASVGSVSYKNYHIALKHKKAVHFKCTTRH